MLRLFNRWRNRLRVRKFRIVTAFTLAAVNVGVWVWAAHGVRGAPGAAPPGPANGFDLSAARIPRSKILGGGPGRDGIPAILEPKFVPVNRVDYLSAGDRVIGVSHGGEAKAYPLKILVFHEIVNDTAGGVPVAVTYCPLCETGMVFSRRVNGRVLTFGVSGLLYQSNVLMYDHQTESLWSQLAMRAVTGPMPGTQLQWLPSEHTTWADWRARNPRGSVLSLDTGFRKPYGQNPYEGYEDEPGTMFPVDRHRGGLPPKALVFGVVVGRQAKAYPAALLAELGGGGFQDQVGGTAVTVSYAPSSGSFAVADARTGRRLPHVVSYWFAWQAFYPDTEVAPAG